MDLGNRIRKLRVEQKQTLEDISTKCGFTKSLLSKIENGKTVPAVATLVKIANSLGVKVSALLDDDESMGTIYTPSDHITRETMVVTNRGYLFFPIAAERRDKLMQPFIFRAVKGQVRTHGLSHDGEEFIYILRGSMRYKVGNIEYTMGPGDSLYFDSLQEHELHPVSEEVEYIAMFAVREK